MYMNEKLTQYLYDACVRVAATPEKEDLLVGLCYVQFHRGYISNEEIDVIVRFLRLTGATVVSTWSQGYEVFKENVEKATAEIIKRDEEKKNGAQ